MPDASHPSLQFGRSPEFAPWLHPFSLAVVELLWHGNHHAHGNMGMCRLFHSLVGRRRTRKDCKCAPAELGPGKSLYEYPMMHSYGLVSELDVCAS